VSDSTFRQRVRRFLGDNLPPGWAGIGAIESHAAADAFVADWRARLSANGLLGITWPTEYGGAGLDKADQVVLVEEMARAGVPAMGVNDTFSIKMLGNTLLRWGTEEQRRHFLPRILSGDDRWCQGYSEPGAGSDLAGLRCAAVLDGDRWVINGQKIWTSRAREANWIFLLARTDPHPARPHQGITFLLVPMDQPGVEVRPIRALSGESEFNEVFFTDATTDAHHVVGEIGGGWAVAMTLLGLERGEEAATNPILFRAELDRLLAMARERGRSDDPVIRQRLADAYARCEIMRFLGQRILHQVLVSGTLGPEASISKLYWSEYHQLVTRLALDVLGADALVTNGRLPLRAYRADDPGAPNTTGSWLGAFYNATAGTIYAGTSQVQRNILGETVLGLPK
jgi:alkylation response protein AidB-like acyl-CoA dehydrogenase